MAYPGFQWKLSMASLIAGLALLSIPAPAATATPTLMWSGAKQLNILCNVAGGPGIDQAALSRILCRDVERLALERAPMPVRTILLGDPAVLASGSVTLLVHASVARVGRDRLLAFSVRPYRTSADQAAVLFGAAPRAATISDRGAASPALDQALRAALSETLPWLMRTPGPQPINLSR